MPLDKKISMPKKLSGKTKFSRASCYTYKVPIGYSDLGYSGCAAYSDLNPRDGPLSLHK